MNASSVFVYGTLRKGGSNHFRMDGAEFVGVGTVDGSMYWIDTNRLVFPALKLDTQGRVLGEVYRVCEMHLKALDAFEGISEQDGEPQEYRRVKVVVDMESGEKAEAWVWEWNVSLDGAMPLPEGDWLLYEPNPS